MGFLEASSLGSKLHSALDDDLNIDGGKRLFFDSRLEDFANQPKSPRSYVQVHSTIDPPPTDPNQPLWVDFWHYDVDDPSSNQPPVDDEWFYTDNRALGGVADGAPRRRDLQRSAGQRDSPGRIRFRGLAASRR